jgi:hypothetical protein
VLSRAPEISAGDERVLEHLFLCLSRARPNHPFIECARIEREFPRSDVQPHVTGITKVCGWRALSAELEIVDLEAIVTYDLVRKAVGQRLDCEVTTLIDERYWRS